jgi:putative Ca2+/H+ antiporter (TMEM165/GDT1 family)
LKLFATVFITIFLAEIADKTQIATMLYASCAGNSKLIVFCGAVLALVTATALAVVVGMMLSQHINEKLMMRLAGGAFIAVGLWTLIQS